jgi:death-on-curing protein
MSLCLTLLWPSPVPSWHTASARRKYSVYAFGIARNHAFVDSNMRTALVVAATFLDRNGWEIEASKEETYTTFLRLAEGSFNEEDLAAWFRQHCGPLKT